jgi:hypothetical protein
MYTYTFSYKKDPSREVVGRITATSMEDAIEQVSIIKRLNQDIVLELFNIERIDK